MLKLASNLPLLKSFHQAVAIWDSGGIKLEFIARPATSQRIARESIDRTLLPKRVFNGDSPSRA
jgi:hypothetical protein